jgi:hypothetical protein
MKFKKGFFPIIGKFNEQEFVYYYCDNEKKNLGEIINTDCKEWIETYTVKSCTTNEEIKITVVENTFSTKGRFEKIWLDEILSKKKFYYMNQEMDSMLIQTKTYEFETFYLYQIFIINQTFTVLSGYLFSQYPLYGNLKLEYVQSKIIFSINSKIIHEIQYQAELIQLLEAKKISYNIEELLPIL